MSNVIPYTRDWSSALTRAEVSMRKGTDALLAREFTPAYDHFAEAKRQLEYALFWITREAGK
jgi:hypothetical protein